MELNSWPGLIAVILSIISFYGTTYLVIALNMGWRFGYWVSAATFGALMVLLSIFWIVNPVGPQGALPRWIPLAAGEQVTQAEFEGQSLRAPARYPTGPWRPAPRGGEQTDSFSSAITNCVTTDPDDLRTDEREACSQAQELMPGTRDIPVLEGAPVAVVPEITDIRLTEDNGTLAQATVVPLTRDPRISRDPDGEALAEEFQIVAILDEGSLRVPAYASLAIFTLFTAFHLWGLHRAEQRKLNPAVV